MCGSSPLHPRFLLCSSLLRNLGPHRTPQLVSKRELGRRHACFDIDSSPCISPMAADSGGLHPLAVKQEEKRDMVRTEGT